MKSKSKRISILATLFALAIIGLSALTLNMTSARGPIHEQDSEGLDGGRYEVTITNLTRGQQFTPILVASHRDGVRLFNFGEPAIPQLARLAEEGDPTQMASLLSGMREVKDVVTSPLSHEGILDPGKSTTLTVRAPYPFDHVSVASMLFPTNDAFFALNGVEGPRGNKELTLYSPAYDAGSERNDELCASIPGPFFSECGGPGGGARVGGGEGFVHVHAGIHGVGNFTLAQRDWRNPVAKITIRRVR
jgi:Spondin_N